MPSDFFSFLITFATDFSFLSLNQISHNAIITYDIATWALNLSYTRNGLSNIQRETPF